ncbi:unnamed protein product [Amoebophrya sp. A25]|nr:unnamed protein product [Amoebophrya sp. A25]|eukprot:GSA25T00010235001.1
MIRDFGFIVYLLLQEVIIPRSPSTTNKKDHLPRLSDMGLDTTAPGDHLQHDVDGTTFREEARVEGRTVEPQRSSPTPQRSSHIQRRTTRTQQQQHHFVVVPGAAGRQEHQRGPNRLEHHRGSHVPAQPQALIGQLHHDDPRTTSAALQLQAITSGGPTFPDIPIPGHSPYRFAGGVFYAAAPPSPVAAGVENCRTRDTESALEDTDEASAQADHLEAIQDSVWSSSKGSNTSTTSSVDIRKSVAAGPGVLLALNEKGKAKRMDNIALAPEAEVAVGPSTKDRDSSCTLSAKTSTGSSSTSTSVQLQVSTDVVMQSSNVSSEEVVASNAWTSRSVFLSRDKQSGHHKVEVNTDAVTAQMLKLQPHAFVPSSSSAAPSASSNNFDFVDTSTESCSASCSSSLGVPSASSDSRWTKDHHAGALKLEEPTVFIDKDSLALLLRHVAAGVTVNANAHEAYRQHKPAAAYSQSSCSSSTSAARSGRSNAKLEEGVEGTGGSSSPLSKRSSVANPTNSSSNGCQSQQEYAEAMRRLHQHHPSAHSPYRNHPHFLPKERTPCPPPGMDIHLNVPHGQGQRREERQLAAQDKNVVPAAAASRRVRAGINSAAISTTSNGRSTSAGSICSSSPPHQKPHLDLMTLLTPKSTSRGGTSSTSGTTSSTSGAGIYDRVLAGVTTAQPPSSSTLCSSSGGANMKTPIINIPTSSSSTPPMRSAFDFQNCRAPKMNYGSGSSHVALAAIIEVDEDASQATLSAGPSPDKQHCLFNEGQHPYYPRPSSSSPSSPDADPATKSADHDHPLHLLRLKLEEKEVSSCSSCSYVTSCAEGGNNPSRSAVASLSFSGKLNTAFAIGTSLPPGATATPPSTRSVPTAPVPAALKDRMAVVAHPHPVRVPPTSKPAPSRPIVPMLKPSESGAPPPRCAPPPPTSGTTSVFVRPPPDLEDIDEEDGRRTRSAGKNMSSSTLRLLTNGTPPAGSPVVDTTATKADRAALPVPTGLVDESETPSTTAGASTARTSCSNRVLEDPCAGDGGEGVFQTSTSSSSTPPNDLVLQDYNTSTEYTHHHYNYGAAAGPYLCLHGGSGAGAGGGYYNYASSRANSYYSYGYGGPGSGTSAERTDHNHHHSLVRSDKQRGWARNSLGGHTPAHSMMNYNYNCFTSGAGRGSSATTAHQQEYVAVDADHHYHYAGQPYHSSWPNYYGGGGHEDAHGESPRSSLPYYNHQVYMTLGTTRQVSAGSDRSSPHVFPPSQDSGDASTYSTVFPPSQDAASCSRTSYNNHHSAPSALVYGFYKKMMGFSPSLSRQTTQSPIVGTSEVARG